MTKRSRQKPIRVGVIGVGRGMSYATGATDLVGMKLVALCDTWKDRLRAVGRQLGVTTYTDYDKFLEHDLDPAPRRTDAADARDDRLPVVLRAHRVDCQRDLLCPGPGAPGAVSRHTVGSAHDGGKYIDGHAFRFANVGATAERDSSDDVVLVLVQ